LRAFQIRDSYEQLQERYMDFQDRSRAETSALQAELDAARHHIWMLQSQLSIVQEESDYTKAQLHATRNELNELRSLNQSEELANRMGGFLQMVRERNSCHYIRASCFGAWHALTSRRKQCELSSSAGAHGDRRFHLCRCLYAWVSHKQNQQALRQGVSKVVAQTERDGHLVMCRCLQAWSTLIAASSNVAQQDAPCPEAAKQDAPCPEQQDAQLQHSRDICMAPARLRVNRKDEISRSKSPRHSGVVILTTESSIPRNQVQCDHPETSVPEAVPNSRHSSKSSCAAPAQQENTIPEVTQSRHSSKSCSAVPPQHENNVSIPEVRRNSLSAPFVYPNYSRQSHVRTNSGHQVISARRPSIIAARA
jgi:hypothetical protein